MREKGEYHNFYFNLIIIVSEEENLPETCRYSNCHPSKPSSSQRAFSQGSWAGTPRSCSPTPSHDRASTSRNTRPWKPPNHGPPKKPGPRPKNRVVRRGLRRCGGRSRRPRTAARRCRRSREGQERWHGSRGMRGREADDAMNTIAQGSRGGRGLLGLTRLMPRAQIFHLSSPLCALFSPSILFSHSVLLFWVFGTLN